MWRSVARPATALATTAAALVVVAACRRAPGSPPPLVAPLSGTVVLDALERPVRVVRDRWGVPHIYAESASDLFVAQGFVQAADRLFQMDLWRRSVQGRLSEVLGPNFIERDAMTRRMQYQGDLDVEWASYGPDTQAIASAFVRGINAWVARARERLPEEFILAGWRPEFWDTEDLLNRTDGFVSSRSLSDDVFRARLVAAVGAPLADRLLPLPSAAATIVPRGIDLPAISYLIGDALQSVGAPPFFLGLASPLPPGVPDRPGGSNAWAVSPARSASGRAIVAGDPHRRLDHPSNRFVVHLHAPGWNVIGATAPWRPGVAIGHNERVAWAVTATAADTGDLYVEKMNPSNPHQVELGGRWVDTVRLDSEIFVKGRAEPLDFVREYSRHGVIVANDRERHLLFAVRWTGFEPGTAAELGALAIDRASAWPDFRAALTRWKLPAAEVVFADTSGTIATQTAALVPVRPGWNGALPVPAWTGRYEWQGWRTLDDLPHTVDPMAGYVAAANESVARTRRLGDVLGGASRFAVDDFERLQHDVLAWNASRLVPLLARVHAERPDVEDARTRLLAWDRRMAVDSDAAAVYAVWERALLQNLARSRLDPALVDQYVARAANVLVPALTEPSRAWFDGDVEKARDRLLVDALAAAVDELKTELGPDGRPQTWGSLHTVLFQHPLALTDATRRRFDVGPFHVGGYAETVFSTSGPGFRVIVGPSFRQIVDVGDWDRAVATQAPGQSGSAASPHFADLAARWAAGEYFPVAFSDEAVRAAAESTLVLVPR